MLASNILKIYYPKVMKPIPEVGKTYNCFDDGKISYGRLYTVDVVDAIPFEDIDKQTLSVWLSKVGQYDWLFAKETDYFIKTANGEDGDAIFVRTLDGGWFSLGDFMNSGMLDVDGELTAILNSR